MTESEIIASNLKAARHHLIHVLTNQGIDWDDATAQAEGIERRLRAEYPSWSDENITSLLDFEAAPFEDM
jgi:hypothetical protein